MTDTDMLYMASLEKRNEELGIRIAELEDKHHNECGQIAHYSDENAKLKELLRKAWDDIRWLNENTVDEEGECVIYNYSEKCDECPLNCNHEIYCGWKHQVEALALIGGGENDT